MNKDLIEFKEKHKRVIETGHITEEFIDEIFQMILDVSKSEERELYSMIRKIFSYMLKYGYDKEKQSKYWIHNIRELYRELFYFKIIIVDVWDSFSEDKLDDIYEDALRDVIAETGKRKEQFSVCRPDYFSKDNISEFNFMEKFLKDNAYTNSAKKVLFLI